MEKKKFLVGALATGLLLFTACSNDEEITTGNGNENAAQAFVLQVASSGDGLSTRAGRPMLSSDAKQTIENVKIIICDETNNVLYVTAITDWNTEVSKPYTTGGHGREKTIEIPTAEKLAVGNYTVYAFGYSSTSDYELATIAEAAKGKTFDANTTLAFKTGATNTVGEEIFAGSYTLKVEAGKGFKQPIVLNRQVAGTFGYVKDIPYIADAAILRLVASNRNQELVLGQFANIDLTGNGNATGTNVKYVINGTKTNDDKVIYSIKLAEWFGEIKDEDANGIIDADSWKAPDIYTDKATFFAGSVFAGEFLIPFAKTADQTFKLELTKEDGSVLRSWNVNLPAADGQLAIHELATWDATDFTTNQATDTKNSYNVVRNHLYGIGERTSDNPTNPGEPDVDNPESLNNKQELTLRVNDNWEVIHSMELE